MPKRTRDRHVQGQSNEKVIEQTDSIIACEEEIEIDRDLFDSMGGIHGEIAVMLARDRDVDTVGDALVAVLSFARVTIGTGLTQEELDQDFQETWEEQLGVEMNLSRRK